MCRIITNAKLGIALGMALMLVSLSTPAHAAKLKQFLANLNAGQQSPPNATTGLGVAHFTFDETTKMLCFAITYTGLSSPEVAAHIHGPGLPGDQAVPPPGAPIIFPLPLGNPKNACVGPLTKTVRGQLLQKMLYVNVHTAINPGGEIWGQILRVK